jgi:hypothetical protein
MSARPNRDELVERLRVMRAEAEKVLRLLEAGYVDLLEQAAGGEIDLDTAMQIFDGRRP